jgi:Tfp pilus assembly protein PilP
MKLTTGILVTAMMAGGAWAQNPDAIDNTRNVMKSLQAKQAADSNAALNAAGVPAKPAPGAPAPAVKPAIIPGSKPAIILASKPAPAATAQVKATAKPASAPASGQANKLERVNVVRNADAIQIEISSREAVTPRVSKLSSPARVVVELPETAMATAQSKIPVGSDGVKGVRIGMDGKTPPTTSVVIDLEKPLSYELTPGPSGKFVLTLHADSVAKSAPAPVPVKTAASAPKNQPVAGKPIMAPPSAAPKVAAAQAAAAKAAATKAAAPAAKQQALAASQTKPAIPGAKPSDKKADAAKQPKTEEKRWAMNGKRDPFFSPVVQQNGGSGCSTGKKCLEIGNINLRGVVKSEAGFIAVVTNSLNKAYFLRENDPVFNGYVVRITGDSVVFQETVQDKLGKPFTREVVKRIFTPAV